MKILSKIYGSELYASFSGMIMVTASTAFFFLPFSLPLFIVSATIAGLGVASMMCATEFSDPNHSNLSDLQPFEIKFHQNSFDSDLIQDKIDNDSLEIIGSVQDIEQA